MPKSELETFYTHIWELRLADSHDKALKLLTEKFETWPEKDYLAQAHFHRLQAQLVRDLGDQSEAWEQYTHSLSYFEQSQQPAWTAYCHRHLGDLAFELSKPEASLSHWRKALYYYQATHKGHALANCHRGLGLALEALGKPQEARAHWKSAKTIYSRQGITEGVAECEQHLRQ
ncbi:MAG TPA: hypothetical protein DCE41_26650 [Cytophagales bacterium]|nr:hypothetical protein [Cytophagales bacterium]HAA18128.1 hypothetical protein [Cytophagales bacterium]HAP61414.1 hypothetical protein [Cytophagales bacterium]